MNRRKLILVVVALLLVSLAVGVVATRHTPTKAQAAGPALVASGSDAYEYMAALTDQVGPRVAGKTGEADGAAYIKGVFESADLGYTVTTQDFQFTLSGVTRQSKNLVVVHDTAATERIVIGAHYDSVGVGRGAFDNASGVAMLLHLAKALKSADAPYDLVFVAFGAEEVGERGSNWYVSHMTTEEKDATVLMVNLDSLNAGDRMYAYSGTSQPWPQLYFRQIARSQGNTILTNPGLNADYPYGSTGDWSDHVPFRKAGIPYLYLESTNWLLADKDGYSNTTLDGQIWHTKKDTLSYIEQRYPGRMAQQLDAEAQALETFLTNPLPIE